MGRRKLSEEERIKSREKRLEYLKKYRKEQKKEREKHYFDNVNDILNSTFYIVDCEDLVYFARKVKILGFGSHEYNKEIEYISDIPEAYCPGEYRKFYLSALTQYKTFKEAQNAAEKLNNMPENKERLKRWIRINFSQEMLEFKYRREI